MFGSHDFSESRGLLLSHFVIRNGKLRLAIAAAMVGSVTGVGILMAGGVATAAPTIWEVTPSQNPSTTQNSLAGASCTSQTFCMGVGYWDSSGVTEALSETFNGTSWTLVPSAFGVIPNNYWLEGVSCTSQTFCMAVGYWNNGIGGPNQTLAETWNGASWTQAPSLNVPGSQNDYLNAVSCTGPTFCEAVGYYTTGVGVAQTLAETWSGSIWTISTSLNTSPTQDNELYGVSCTSQSFCAAVGEFYNGSIDQTLAETWNGTAWAVTPSPNPGLGTDYFSGVSCTSQTFCEAVGYYSDILPVGSSLAATWDGSSWTQTPSQNEGDHSFLQGVSCTSPTDCVAVGWYVVGSILPKLIENFNGSSFTAVPGPSNVPADAYLLGVSCTSQSFCAAVGWQDPSLVEQTLAEIGIVPSPGSPPSAPTNLSASDGAIILNWGPPVSNGTSPVTSYEVYRFTQSSAAALIATVTAPTTTSVDSNVPAGVTYSYYVEATNAFGASPPSNVVSVTAPSGPPPSGACSSYSGNAAFVCALYEDILGRAPDSAGLSTWMGALSSGASTTQVAYDIAASNEYRTDFVQADYMAFLGRPADPGGLATWVGALNSGATDEQVDSGIHGSAEFFSDSGSTNSGFVNAVYQDLLGRSADPGGLSTWTSALASGTTRTEVAYAIDTSNESRTDTVQLFYQTLLNRPADPGGLATWVGALNSGATDEQVIAGIAGSPEFYSDAPTA